MNWFRYIFTSRSKKHNLLEIDPEDVFLDSKNLSSLNTNQLEGQLEKPLEKYVFYSTICLVGTLICFVSYRLFMMQIVNYDSFQEKADSNSLKRVPLFSLRGTISDRNGIPLAWNTTSFSQGTTSQELPLLDDIPKRSYIKDTGFAHLLGYVSYPKKDKGGTFWQDEYLGKDGIEKEYQDNLSGVRGERLIEVSARNNVQTHNVVIYPTHGENITLTIDKGVQAKLFESIETLAEKASFTGGAGIIMDVTNGEVLAITSYPEYDNNLIANATTQEEKNQVAKDLLDKKKKFLNRAVGGLFTPGSTVKPFFAYAALVEGVIDPEKSIYSSGQLIVKNKYDGPDTVFKDWKAHGYVNMRQAIAASSDEYFYQIGGGYKSQKGLGILRIEEYARLFGLGSKTGIDLPGETTGIIPNPIWKKKRFNEDWLLGNTYHSSIGQYGFQVTPIELVRAIASIANGGYLVTPHVYKEGVVGTSSLNLNQKDLKVIQEGMHMAVNSEIGTGKVLQIKGVDIAAKSGTAELGVSKQFVNSWITGYFPYDNPKYAFVVIMEKGDRHNPQGAVFALRWTLEWMRDETEYLK